MLENFRHIAQNIPYSFVRYNQIFRLKTLLTGQTMFR